MNTKLDKLKELVTTIPIKVLTIIIKSKYKDIYEFIMENTKYMSKYNYRFTQRIYQVIHGLNDFPVCKNENCNKKLNKLNNFKNLESGYAQFCCPLCSKTSMLTIHKILHTKLINHGSTSYVNPIKAKQTRYKKYGQYEAPNTNEKRKQTTLLRYGVNNYAQTIEYKQKTKQSLKQRYGEDVENPFQLKAVKEKIQNTLITQYGSACPPSWSYKYDNKLFDSSWEVAYYIWLTDHNIQFEYPCKTIFKYYDYNGNEFLYYPDFKVGNKIIEIKGSQFYTKDGRFRNPYDKTNDYAQYLMEQKHKCMIDNNVDIINHIKIKQYLDYITQTYGKNYLKQFKKSS